MWSWCPEEQCFAFDIHRHLRGECWLKFQLTDNTRPKDPVYGHQAFPSALRAAPRKIWPFSVAPAIWPGPVPSHVPWTSGVIAPANAIVRSAEPNDKWRRRWCERHGPCEHVGLADSP